MKIKSGKYRKNYLKEAWNTISTEDTEEKVEQEFNDTFKIDTREKFFDSLAEYLISKNIKKVEIDTSEEFYDAIKDNVGKTIFMYDKQLSNNGYLKFKFRIYSCYKRKISLDEVEGWAPSFDTDEEYNNYINSFTDARLTKYGYIGLFFYDYICTSELLDCWGDKNKIADIRKKFSQSFQMELCGLNNLNFDDESKYNSYFSKNIIVNENWEDCRSVYKRNLKINPSNQFLKQLEEKDIPYIFFTILPKYGQKIIDNKLENGSFNEGYLDAIQENLEKYYQKKNQNK